MVIGSGLLAKRFAQYDTNEKFLIFASGVSNSKSTEPEQFAREFELLKTTFAANPGKTFVYFSTCSVNDPAENRSPYVQHKIQIEQYIARTIPNYVIFRVSNLVGSTSNTNTIFNFIVRHIQEGKPFDVWTNANRNLIDVDDLYTIVDHILCNSLFSNQVVNIANPVSYPVPEIVSAAERFFHTKANCTFVDKGAAFAIDISDIQPIIIAEHINFDEGYLMRLFQKYYRKDELQNSTH